MRLKSFCDALRLNCFAVTHQCFLQDPFHDKTSQLHDQIISPFNPLMIHLFQTQPFVFIQPTMCPNNSPYVAHSLSLSQCNNRRWKALKMVVEVEAFKLATNWLCWILAKNPSKNFVKAWPIRCQFVKAFQQGLGSEMVQDFLDSTKGWFVTLLLNSTANLKQRVSWTKMMTRCICWNKKKKQSH
jgi:hypothetical protein